MEQRLRNSTPQQLKASAFFITTLLFALCYLFVGWWTDSYQHMYDTAISGEFTNYYLPAAHNPYPEYMPGAAFVLNQLGQLIPIRWVAFFLNSVLFVSIWVIFYNTLKHIRHYPIGSVGLLIVFLSVLFCESIILYHMVRITMFAGIASLSYFLVNDDPKWLSKKAAPYLLLFIVALWIRCNVHLFLLTFLTGAFILHKRSVKPMIVFWLAFSLFFLYYCKIVFWTDYSNDLNGFFLYNTEFKLQHTGEHERSLRLENELDSIKYEAIQNEIFADEENLSPSFYYKIGILDNVDKFSITHAWYAFHQFAGTVSENLHFVIIDLVLILFYMLLGGVKTKNFRANTLLLFLFFYAIVAALSFVKMENRFLVPFQVFFLLTILMMHQPAIFSARKHSYVLAFFVCFSGLISFHFINMKVEYAKSFTANSKKSYEWMKQNYPDVIVVVNDGFITCNRPYETFYQRKYFKEFFSFNYFATQLHPLYSPYLEIKCSCNVGNHVEFYDYLLHQKSESLILDRGDRVKVLSKYLKMVYNRDFAFTEIPTKEDKFHFEGFGENLKLFRLSKGMN